MKLTEEIVKRLKAKMDACPTCGTGHTGIRDHAKASGLTTSTLWRVTNGHSFDSKTLDKLAEYLNLELKP